MNESASGGLARRALGWIILVVVAIIALKVVFGVVIGLASALFSLALLVLVVMGVLWALRHI
jgi:hypothetical protein